MNNAAKKVDAKPPLTLAEMVREALQDRDWNQEKAINFVMARLRNEPELLKMIIADAVKFAVTEHTGHAIRSQREYVMRHGTSSSGPSGHARVVALARGNAATLLDFPLYGGLKLGDATREKVGEDAARYSRQSLDMGHKARWLSLIAQCVPDGKVVSEVLTSERVKELWEETENA